MRLTGAADDAGFEVIVFWWRPRYRVAEADTVQRGLRMITQEPPDLIVLDLGFPDGDGK